ncbi:tetraspanin-33-like [Ornithodoros turicata]|uniref:tetraspanin-33-like n=1 Tax=Ornithodoros turicata TaxID=34597 RepID=UPI003139E5A9
MPFPDSLRKIDPGWRLGKQSEPSFSSTIKEDVNLCIRVPLIVCNLLIMFSCLVVFWCGVVALINRPDDEGSFWNRLGHIKSSVKEHYFKDFIVGYRENPDYQNIVDSVQDTLRCCGMSDENFRDWNLNPYFRCEEKNPSRERCNVPYSCCRPNASSELPRSTLCGAKVLTLDDQAAWERVYVRSCADAVVSGIRNRIPTIMAVSMACIFVLLLLFVSSVRLKDEVNVMNTIYEAYYSNLIAGQKEMKKMGVCLPPKSEETEELPEVSKALGTADERVSLTKRNAIPAKIQLAANEAWIRTKSFFGKFISK